MVANLVPGNIKTKKDVHQPDNCQQQQQQRHNTFWRNYVNYHNERRSKFYIGTCAAVFLLVALPSLILFLPILTRLNRTAVYDINVQDVPCGSMCRIELVESIPEGMTYNSTIQHASTFDVWKNMIETSNFSIEIASFYWTLRENETYSHPSSKKGEEIYQALLEAGLNRKIAIRIAQNEPSTFQKNPDTEFLDRVNAAQVRSLNFTRLVGAGVLHTKFWIVDRKHVYVGSANMDWRSLTQVKELGAVVYDCPCIANDLAKIFEVYWTLGNATEVPNKWPEKYATKYNANTPLNVTFNNLTNLVYFSSSPPSFSTKGRTHDIDALLRTISSAKKFIYIAVMDYFPLTLYTKTYKFWPIIDNEIRRAVIERQVNVRILISQWRSTRHMIYNFMNSLKSLDHFNKKVEVEVRKFKVPSTPSQQNIPFARVNHNKYMVTDNGVFIGTSNWSADYFINTAGVSLVMSTNNSTDDTIRRELVDVFLRDWSSSYSSNIY